MYRPCRCFLSLYPNPISHQTLVKLNKMKFAHRLSIAMMGVLLQVTDPKSCPRVLLGKFL